MPHLREQLHASLGDRYTIERELTGGGMSRVFVARETALGRTVVVKVLPPDLLAGINIERFDREIQLAAALQHPHIVPVLTAGRVGDVPYYTMPFVDGESLRHRLAAGPLPIADTVNILRDVARALAYAHDHGVVHRDIKPDNVLLSGGSATVTDFGIAKALAAAKRGEHASVGGLTAIGTSIGTPAYMAPEQAAADPATDHRADLYSFGCLAYELLAGQPPFAGKTPQRLLAAHMAESPRNVVELRPDTPPLLAELVMQCLEKQPERRPARANDVVRLLDASTSSGGREALASALLGRRVRVSVALTVWAIVFAATWIVAKAAIIAIGLPNWVVPGALIVAGLGLPAILFTAFVQRTARHALTRTPTLTPGGGAAAPSTMATIAIKASPYLTWTRTIRGGYLAFGAFALLVAAFMALRALGVGPFGSLLASGRMGKQQPLLITDFTVKKGDSTLAGVVAEAMRASLAQSTSIALVPQSKVEAALQRMQAPAGARLDLALARSVAMREGIHSIVDGDVTQIGSGFVVTVRLVTADSGVTIATVQRAVDNPKEMIAGIDAMGRELRGKIGESLRSVQNTPSLEQVTTPSLEALRRYTEGRRLYTANADIVGAVARLREAVAIDTGFAMAWRQLASVYVAGRYPAGTVDSMLEKAYQFRNRLTRKERLVAETNYFMRSTMSGDRARAMATAEQLFATGDSDVTELVNYGVLLASRRQFAKAESLFNSAIRHSYGQPAYNNLIGTYSSDGKLDKANSTIEEMLARMPRTGRSIAMLTRVNVLYNGGEIARAERLADSLVAAPANTNRIRTLIQRSRFAGLHGRAGDIESRLRDLRTFSNTNGIRTISLSDSAVLALYDATSAEQPARAVRRLDAALAATPLSTLAAADRNYLGLATIYARAGRSDKAKVLLDERRAEIRDSINFRGGEARTHRVLAEIAIAEGRPKDALREFWKGDSLPDGPADDCAICTYVNVARAYDKLAAADSAIVYFEKYFAGYVNNRLDQVDFAARAPAARRLGELYEAKGDRANAVKYYQQFLELWKNADPELQPQVADVKKRVARLGDLEGSRRR